MTKFKLIIRLIFAKRFMVIIGVKGGVDVVSSFSDKEICRSGNAFYIVS